MESGIGGTRGAHQSYRDDEDGQEWAVLRRGAKGLGSGRTGGALGCVPGSGQRRRSSGGPGVPTRARERKSQPVGGPAAHALHRAPASHRVCQRGRQGSRDPPDRLGRRLCSGTRGGQRQPGQAAGPGQRGGAGTRREGPGMSNMFPRLLDVSYCLPCTVRNRAEMDGEKKRGEEREGRG